MVGCFEPPMPKGMEPMRGSGMSDEEAPESDEEDVTSEDERGDDEQGDSRQRKCFPSSPSVRTVGQRSPY